MKFGYFQVLARPGTAITLQTNDFQLSVTLTTKPSPRVRTPSFLSVNPTTPTTAGSATVYRLISRLDYLSRLGVTCLWLNPVHPSPQRDNGYDITDYYGVDPRLGSLGDFTDLMAQTRERGMRVIIDLVVNHTSDQHPWFQAARNDPDSKYRDYYIWSDEEPPDRFQGTVFPGEQTETWTFDEQAEAWYFHRFYDFQPDLNWDNPLLREEIKKMMGFWLQLGVSGFRIDAAPFVLERVAPGVDPAPKDFSILDDWRQDVQWRSRDAVLLCEANVDPVDLPKYTGVTPDGRTTGPTCCSISC